MCLAVFILLLVFLYGSILIYGFEKNLESSIVEAKDAMWWTFLNILNAKIGLEGVASEEAKVTTVILNRFGFVLFALFNGVFLAWLLNIRKNESKQGNI